MLTPAERRALLLDKLARALSSSSSKNFSTHLIQCEEHHEYFLRAKYYQKCVCLETSITRGFINRMFHNFWDTYDPVNWAELWVSVLYDYLQVIWTEICHGIPMTLDTCIITHNSFQVECIPVSLRWWCNKHSCIFLQCTLQIQGCNFYSMHIRP